MVAQEQPWINPIGSYFILQELELFESCSDSDSKAHHECGLVGVYSYLLHNSQTNLNKKIIARFELSCEGGRLSGRRPATLSAHERAPRRGGDGGCLDCSSLQCGAEQVDSIQHCIAMRQFNVILRSSAIAMHCNAIIQCNIAIEYTYNTMQSNTIQYNTMQSNTMQSNTIQ